MTLNTDVLLYANHSLFKTILLGNQSIGSQGVVEMAYMCYVIEPSSTVQLAIPV